MARTVKIDNSLFKRLRLKEENEKRKAETKVKRERYLIVCEGGKTEPYYFKSIEKLLPKGIIELNILGMGANTTAVVNYAIKEKAKAAGTLEEYDKVWVVFDKDDFPDRNFNNAIFAAQNNNIECAQSNEAFELWYVLHFQYLNTALKREQYFDILSNILEEKYQKNNIKMYEILRTRGSETKAINWAEKLAENYDPSNPSNCKPHTNVHELVKALNKFKEQ